MKTRLLLLMPLVALGAILVLAQQSPAPVGKLNDLGLTQDLKQRHRDWTEQTPEEGAKAGQKFFQLPGSGGAPAVDLQPILTALATQAEYMKGLRARIDTLERRVAQLEQQIAPNSQPATPNNR